MLVAWTGYAATILTMEHDGDPRPSPVYSLLIGLLVTGSIAAGALWVLVVQRKPKGKPKTEVITQPLRRPSSIGVGYVPPAPPVPYRSTNVGKARSITGTETVPLGEIHDAVKGTAAVAVAERAEEAEPAVSDLAEGYAAGAAGTPTPRREDDVARGFVIGALDRERVRDDDEPGDG
jgi:hypothetical protein